MKRFSSLRRKKIDGRSKSIMGMKAVVSQEKGKYNLYIDGDFLDAYRNEREAFKAAEAYIKQYRKMK
tara:strand:+ start:43 stop:243 length:201 start_codon:yes stop_codon:yes gene_type:complete